MAAQFAVAAPLAFAAVLVLSPDLFAQPRRPLPSGNRIVAQDGDIIVLEHDERVRIVRRREAMVRVMFNATERWLVLLADFRTAAGAPDARVDMAYNFRGISGDWPIEARWQGLAALEESSLAPDGGSSSLAIAGPFGLIQLLGSPNQDPVRDPTAIAVLSYQGAGRGTILGISFDEAERQQLAEIRGDASGQSSVRKGIGFTLENPRAAASGAPIRVGGNMRAPAKIVDVPAVVPEQAIQARIKGVVIVEITIDTDGSVKEARVLRSIPLLDEAALDAVRQWRYESPTLNGQPVAVVMTVIVPFP